MPQLFETRTPEQHIVRYARVALEQSIDLSPEGLTYAVPETLQDLAVGERVTVPLGRGNKPATGYITAFEADVDLPREKIKVIIARGPGGVSLPADLMALAQWIAAYYCSPLGMVLQTMLPAAVKHGTGKVMQRLVRLNSESPAPDARPPRLSALQKKALELAKQLADTEDPWIDPRELAGEAGARTVTPVKQLIEKGLLIQTLEAAVRAHRGCVLGQNESIAPRIEDAQVTGAQRQTVDALARALDEGFSVHLLHGVTGSGKTEVYLRLIEQLPNDRQAIVLVPEIALTPQTVGRFVQRFGEENVAVLHSGLTPAQRHQQWRRIREDEARIVVGARSAIFAPVRSLGLVIVDEEHEQTYKQDQVPRYHARDVAIRRTQQRGVPIVLGSATPSLESYFNAVGDTANSAASARSDLSTSHTPAHRYRLHRLPDRVAGQRLPRVHVVDMTDQRRARYEMTGKAGIHLLSIPLEKTLQRTFKDGGQAMLLLNRRGYANYIACPDQRCGWIMMCDACDALMVYHKHKDLPTGGFVRCHHCTAEQMLPETCPNCSRRITTFGLGTQRVEEEIERKFPDVSVIRMDSDTMRSASDYHEALEAFRKGQVQLLVGTQMIAKGLDFPNVQVVGVISADTSLHLPDFRAPERTFQLIAQVAGRSGRSDQLGEVIVQTFNPHDPAILLASRHDYEAFAQRELATRAEVGLPPVGRMARIVVRDRDFVACVDHANQLARQLQQINRQYQLDIQLRGPMPAPIARIAEHHRQQIELLATPPHAAGRIQKLLTALRNAGQLRADARTAIDVDPVALL